MTARTAHTAQIVEIRSRDADRSREEILRAAMTEFADHGFGGARIEAIAERAGVNKKLIYYYYAAKDELFLAVLEQSYADIRAAEHELHLETSDPIEAIRSLVGFTWRHYLAHPEFLALLNTENLAKARHLKRSTKVKSMHSPFVEMIRTVVIRGVESDLGEVRVADIEELLLYCYRVAGTVGLMMTAALDVTTPEALPHAIDLGIAMQLTNICRDVREDALIGRRYLPLTLVGALEPSLLVDPTGPVRETAMQALRTLLDLADRYYASGAQGLVCLPARARTGILVAAELYRGIGVMLRRREYDCWSSRAMVGTAGKAAITLRVFAETVGRPRSGNVRDRGARSHRDPLLPFAAAWSTKAGVAD